jgi:8-oxo-dGTP diphosphatase
MDVLMQQWRQCARAVYMPIIRMYWRIYKPRTYGVKVLILHPRVLGEVLLVRHTYGNQSLWNIPGGGYAPNKETPEVAGRREVREELGVELVTCTSIGLYETSGEGKRDTVTLLVGTVDAGQVLVPNDEIAALAWEAHTQVRYRTDVARVARQAIKILYPE